MWLLDNLGFTCTSGRYDGWATVHIVIKTTANAANKRKIFLLLKSMGHSLHISGFNDWWMLEGLGDVWEMTGYNWWKITPSYFWSAGVFMPIMSWLASIWRDGWVDESDGLENRCGGNVTVGSNPTLSAMLYIQEPCRLNPAGLLFT